MNVLKKALFCLLLGFLLAQGLTAQAATCTCANWETNNCEMNPTGNPMGGGVGYNRIVDRASAKYIVSTKDQLISALANAVSGDIIYVDDGATITFGPTDYGYTIAGGVTLAGGRGRAGVVGGQIISNINAASYMGPIFLKSTGPGVRITGLSATQTNNVGCNPQYYGTFFWPEYDAEVDNNEINGWGFAGVWLNNVNYADLSKVLNVYIHHNYIHYFTGTCSYAQYGVIVSNWGDTQGHKAIAVVEANKFDYNWHSIAATGTVGEGYVARYNWVGPHEVAQSFDCHGGQDRGDGTTIACSRIDIYGNTMLKYEDWPTILIRGIPDIGGYVHNNYIKQDGTVFPRIPIAQKDSDDAPGTPPTDWNWANMHIGNNCYGSTCNGTGCVSGTGLTCQDDCVGGTRQCAGSTAYQICGASKYNGCIGWMPAISCPSGKTCSNGACGSNTPITTSTTTSTTSTSTTTTSVTSSSSSSSSTSSTSTLRVPGDADGDGQVNYDDLIILAASYGTQTGEGGYDPRADFNSDGVVDYDDLIILAANYEG